MYLLHMKILYHKHSQSCMYVYPSILWEYEHTQTNYIWLPEMSNRFLLMQHFPFNMINYKQLCWSMTKNMLSIKAKKKKNDQVSKWEYRKILRFGLCAFLAQVKLMCLWSALAWCSISLEYIHVPMFIHLLNPYHPNPSSDAMSASMNA